MENSKSKEEKIEKRGYTEKEAAIYLAVSCIFLRQDRMNGFRKGRTLGPNYVKNGRIIRYLKEDLDRWLDKHRVERIEEDLYNTL